MHDAHHGRALGASGLLVFLDVGVFFVLFFGEDFLQIALVVGGAFLGHGDEFLGLFGHFGGSGVFEGDAAALCDFSTYFGDIECEEFLALFAGEFIFLGEFVGGFGGYLEGVGDVSVPAEQVDIVFAEFARGYVGEPIDVAFDGFFIFFFVFEIFGVLFLAEDVFDDAVVAGLHFGFHLFDFGFLCGVCFFQVNGGIDFGEALQATQIECLQGRGLSFVEVVAFDHFGGLVFGLLLKVGGFLFGCGFALCVGACGGKACHEQGEACQGEELLDAIHDLV